MGKSLTLENLETILNAMQKIEKIDRSACFNSYLDELKRRIDNLKKSNK